MQSGHKMDAFSELMEIAQAQQGYFTTRQAIAAGFADNTHTYHVRVENWERVRRGIYRLKHLSPAEDGLTPAYLLWTRGRDDKPVGVLSHETALSYFDLGYFNPPKVHLTVPVGFRRNSQPPKAVVLHKAEITPAEITLLRGMPICRVSRALCDVVLKNVLAQEECRVLVREARRRGLILESEIQAAKVNPRFSAIAGKLFA